MTIVPHVLVVGDVMRDVIVVPEQALRRGSDVNATIRFTPGGSAANQARWLAAESVDVTLVARVGAGDAELLTAEFAEAGVDAVLAEDADLPTGALVSLSEPDGDRSFFSDRGANTHLALSDMPEGVLAEADMVLLSGYVFFAEAGRRTARGLIEMARKAGTAVALDAASAGYISDVGVTEFIGWTRGIDLLLANEEEAGLLTGKGTPDAQLAALNMIYGQCVLKRGAAGAVGYSETGELVHASASDANCVDSTGAGDAFAAGFLAAHLTAQAFASALAAGNRAAARAIGHLGGGPARPERKRAL